VEEVVALLSARSPKLTRALAKAKKDGLSHLILDGTLIYTDGSARTGRTTPASIGRTE
jgi:hypothetical protein